MKLVLLKSILLSMATCSLALEYGIVGFPDTLECDQDSTIQIVLRNNSKTVIQIKEFSEPVDITFTDSTGDLKSIMRYRARREINFNEIKPGKFKTIRANVAGYYFKDSVLDSRKSRLHKDTMDIFIRSIIKGTSIPVDTLFKSEELFQKDTSESSARYKNSVDAILANMCCLQHPVSMKLPYQSGNYSVGIYVNVVDLKSVKGYHFIKKNIFIKCE